MLEQEMRREENLEVRECEMKWVKALAEEKEKKKLSGNDPSDKKLEIMFNQYANEIHDGPSKKAMILKFSEKKML